MVSTTVPGEMGELGFFVALIVMLGNILVHIALAVGVHADASLLRRRGLGPTFVGPALWTLAALLGGVFSTGVYWIIHHSTLRPTVTAKPPEGPGEL